MHRSPQVTRILRQCTLILSGGLVLFGFQNCSEVAVDPVVVQQLKKANVELDYCPLAGQSLVSVFAANNSAVKHKGYLVVDKDRDGLSDAYERDPLNKDYVLSSQVPDSNFDGYNDLVTVVAGYDEASQQTLQVCADPTKDSDNDMLMDCEENLLGTDYQNIDHDSDGLPDGVEVRYGLNPMDPSDAQLDADGNGVANTDEIQKYATTGLTNGGPLLGALTQYSLQNNGSCYKLQVSNLSLVSVSNGNLLRVQIVEANSLGVRSMRVLDLVVPIETTNHSVIPVDFKTYTRRTVIIPVGWSGESL